MTIFINCVYGCQKKLLMLRLVYCNRLVNLGISKQQHLYLRTKQFNLKKYLTKYKTLKKINIKINRPDWVQCVPAS